MGEERRGEERRGEERRGEERQPAACCAEDYCWAGAGFSAVSTHPACFNCCSQSVMSCGARAAGMLLGRLTHALRQAQGNLPSRSTISLRLKLQGFKVPLQTKRIQH